MPSTMRGLALLLVPLAVLAFCTPALARSAAQSPSKELPPRLQQAREHWNELTPAERQRVRQNYRRWKELDAGQREELRRRAARLKAERETVERDLPVDVKRDLSRLDGRKRRQVLRDLTEARVNESGRRIRSKMPKDFLRELEAAPPQERPKLLRAFKRQQRGRVTRAAIEVLGRQLELTPTEVRELQSLPEDRRARAVLELRRRLSSQEVSEDVLPHGLTWEQWDEWSRLSPEEFYRRIVEFRRERMQAIQAQRRERAVQRRERAIDRMGDRVGDRLGERLDRFARGSGGGRPTQGTSAPTRRTSTSSEMDPRASGDHGPGASRRPMGAARGAPLPRVLRRLAEAVRPDPRDALELIELSRPERKEAMARRRRARCMQLITGEDLLPEERVRQLQELSNEEFFDVIRRILQHTGHLGLDAPNGGADLGPDDGPR